MPEKNMMAEEGMMPEGFDKCVKEGGRVRTMKLNGGRHMRICYDKSGKSHAGEVRQGKEEKKGG